MKHYFKYLLALPVFFLGGSVVWTCNFDAGSIPGLLLYQRYSAAYGQQYNSDTTDISSVRSCRFELHASDPKVNQGKRAEIRDTVTTTQERWYGLSTFLPTSFVPDTMFEIITQFHGLESTGTGPPIALKVKYGRYYCRVQWRNSVFANGNDDAIDGSYEADLGPVTLNRWQHWVWHIKFSYTSTGFIELWHNEQLVFRRNGPNSYNSPVYPYFKAGIYKPGWADGSYSAGISSRVIFIDELRCANASGDYFSVSPVQLPTTAIPLNLQTR